MRSATSGVRSERLEGGGADAQVGEQVRGPDERVGDRAARVEVERGGDAAADLADEDRVLERRGGVELGEALQRGFVGVTGEADHVGVGGEHVGAPGVVCSRERHRARSYSLRGRRLARKCSKLRLGGEVGRPAG